MRAKKQNLEFQKNEAIKKRALTEKRIFEAINRIESNQPIHIKKGALFSVASVAREAEVSRGHIYEYPNVVKYINQAKTTQRKRIGISDDKAKSNELYKINKQLSVDKENLARENNRLQSENEEFREKMQRYMQEIDELRTKLAEKSKLAFIKKTS